jgi:hypothetical protein
MSKLILAAIFLLCATAAQAGNCTQSRVGSFTYTNCDDGWNGSSSDVGGFTYHNFNGPNGQSQNCTTSYVGSFAYTNCN